MLKYFLNSNDDSNHLMKMLAVDTHEKARYLPTKHYNNSLPWKV